MVNDSSSSNGKSIKFGLPFISVFVAVSFFLPALLYAEVTLESCARTNVPVVQTVSTRDAVSLAPGDQTNNFKPGDKVLSLSGKGFTSLDGIAKLPVLDQGRETVLADVKRLHLYLNRNNLDRLPPEFFELQNVIFVYLYYNRFEAIPPQIAQLHGLLGMYLGNRLTSIAPEVFTMKQLRKFQVSKNRITEIPAAIGALTELIHLNLSGNLIPVVPFTFAKLTKLRVCDLSDNRIEKLPEGFGQVRIVHQLRVRNNPLTALPAAFADIPRTIDITGTRTELDRLSPRLRARINTEKPKKDPKPASSTLQLAKPMLQPAKPIV